MEKLNGKLIAREILKEIKERLKNTRKQRPSLAIILVGNRSDSELYVKLKEKAAKKVGIKTNLYKFSKNINEEKILKTIDFLNADLQTDAIIVQLPLPNKINTFKIIKRIDPQKDADGFHPQNIKKIATNCDCIKLMPPIFRVILEFLKRSDCFLKDKEVLIFSNSDIFGKNLKKVLKFNEANVKIKKGQAEKNFFKADIIISAVGKPGFIKSNKFKNGVVLIDIGITKKNKKVYGDFDMANTENKKGFYTPVPGGTGPVTVAMLLKNVLELHEKRNN